MKTVIQKLESYSQKKTTFWLLAQTFFKSLHYYKTCGKCYNEIRKLKQAKKKPQKLSSVFIGYCNSQTLVKLKLKNGPQSMESPNKQNIFNFKQCSNIFYTY